jgi:ubiquinone/menaquinone biosynthesis C-methylase UbiE
VQAATPKALAVGDLYPAVIALLKETAGGPSGVVLDVPAGQGAFAQALLALGDSRIECLDINAEAFVLRDPRAAFTRHDVAQRLPFPDAHFDQVFSIEGIEHFDNPWTFVTELGRVLKPGGWMFVSTPNTFSVDARLKYLVSGYFPRFRPLMQEPDKVMDQDVDDAHVSPIYFWQLNYYLMRSGLHIERIGTNASLRKRQWSRRLFEAAIAAAIRRNMRRRRFPDPGVTSDAVLYGDCLVLAARKRPG